MPALRDQIRKYETDTGVKIKCWGIVRTLSCPLSSIGCPGARFWMKSAMKSAPKEGEFLKSYLKTSAYLRIQDAISYRLKRRNYRFAFVLFPMKDVHPANRL
jgi:hypothetical protein